MQEAGHVEQDEELEDMDDGFKFCMGRHTAAML